MAWSADGFGGWSADGYPGWSADGFLPNSTGGGTTGTPIIATQPTSVTVLAGQTATFYVTVTNAVTAYQWLLNGVAIAGATAASYTTGAASSSMTGNAYSVLLQNSVGMTSSKVAYLTVVLSVQLLSALIWDGELPGIMMNKTRSYKWNNHIQEAVSGKETRIQLMQYPRVQFEMQYELLRDNLYISEAKTLAGIYNACAADFGTFLFRDGAHNSVSYEFVGIGNGLQTAYQLVANYQPNGGVGAQELIQNFNGAPIVYVNGASVSYALGVTGIVTLATPPAVGSVVSWSGSFYYRVRFLNKDMPLTRFMANWWSSQKIQLLSVKL